MRPNRLIIAVFSVTWLLILWLLIEFITEDRKLSEGLSRNMEDTAKQLALCRETSPQTHKTLKICSPGFIWQHAKCVKCPRGTFGLPQWTVCESVLTCDDILHEVRISKLLYTLGNWHYYQAEWKGYEVVYGKIHNENVGINSNAILALSPHPNLLYPIGFCEEQRAIVFSIDQWRGTHSVGSVSELNTILVQTGCDNWMVRFQLCLDYIRILYHLHTEPSGPYVFCNSHSLELILSQFLISADLQMLLVNYDNLPQVRIGTNNTTSPKSLVKCSKSELKNDFVAPEQKWPLNKLKVFNSDEQPGYNEKTDVWKIPDVARVLLGADSLKTTENEHIMDYLVAIHHKCKRINPDERPAISDVLKEYELVWKLLSDA